MTEPTYGSETSSSSSLLTSDAGIEGRYAAALYSAASQMNQLEQVESSLQLMLQEIDTEPKMQDFLLSSDVSAAKKADAMKYMGEKMGWPAATNNFLSLVAENGRLRMLRKMITLFVTIMAAHKGEVQCEVITAKKLDDSSRQALLDALAAHVDGKKIQLAEKVKPEIIGGMIVSIDDKVVDMSIARKINMYVDILKMPI